MAELQTAESGGKKKHGGKVRSKKMSTHIDMTPMVDLGFLLITFFMLTTTLSKPQVMEIGLPSKEKVDEQPPTKESKVLTVLLGENDKIYYYHGITNPKLDSTDFSAEGIRKILLQKKADVIAQFGSGEAGQAIILIKPNENSRYKNTVDMMDEIDIVGGLRPVLLDISKAEQDFIKNPTAGLRYNPTDIKNATKN
ncbi:MAG: biopolymer transporter ExbD [Saprospiraceae bacterium]|nr:biopolymer transporter ExbD [Saprospiraceae bacterium]MBP7699466.1 biopolymer transporter ExbD [Saprospiraceae bacterium]